MQRKKPLWNGLVSHGRQKELGKMILKYTSSGKAKVTHPIPW